MNITTWDMFNFMHDFKAIASQGDKAGKNSPYILVNMATKNT